MASSNNSDEVLEYVEKLPVEQEDEASIPEPIQLPSLADTIVGSQEKQAQPTSSSAAPITRSNEKVSNEQKPELRLRLRATPNACAISEFKLNAWKLKACFKSCVLRQMSTLAINPLRISVIPEMEKLLKDSFDTTDAAEYQQLKTLNCELKQELQRCCDFFFSYPAIFDRHAKNALFLTTEQMNNFEEELRSTLARKLEVNKHEKNFLIAISQGVLTNILTTLKAQNAEIQQVEEQLARSFCDSAFAAYADNVSRRLSGRICSSNEIWQADQQTSKEVFEGLNVTTSELQTRIKQYIQELMDSNARKLDEFHKNSMDAFETCRSVFDRLFTRKNEFCSLGDLKEDGESALGGALEKFSEVQEHLLPADKIHVRQMLRNYAFDTMLKCAPETPKAAEVLVSKPNITAVFSFFSPLEIHVEGLELEPIMFNSHLWFKNGKLMVIDSRLYKKFKSENTPRFKVNALALDGFYTGALGINDDFVNAIGSSAHPEQLIAAYYKAMKRYLMEALHVIPSTLTFIVEDSTNFVRKHRISSALRLAGLPPPKFMRHTGAVIAGYFDLNSVSSTGSTLFFIVRDDSVIIAQCHFSNIVKISSIDSEESNAFDVSSSARIIVDQVRQNPGVHSVVLIHDFNDQNQSWEKIGLKSLLPSHVTRFHQLHATDAQLTSLAVGGAAFVNKYSSDAVYSESALYELSYQCGNKPVKVLVRPGECIEQNVFDVALVEDLVLNESFGFSVFENSLLVANFDIPSCSRTDKLIFSIQLRKDGVLSKPEIRSKSSNRLVEWKMTGPLMPWNDPNFQEIQDPEIAMWKLSDLESTPIMLKNLTFDRPEGNGCSSEANDVPSFQRPEEHDAEKEKLRKLAEDVRQALDLSSAPKRIRKRAGFYLVKAQIYLGTRVPRDIDIRPCDVEIGPLIQRLQFYLFSLRGFSRKAEV